MQLDVAQPGAQAPSARRPYALVATEFGHIEACGKALAVALRQGLPHMQKCATVRSTRRSRMRLWTGGVAQRSEESGFEGDGAALLEASPEDAAIG